jgi:nitrogen-specific signal transduction histidine kinase
VENSLTGISIFQNGRLVYRNPEHVRLLGAVPKAAERPYPDNIHPEDAGKVKELFKGLLEGNLRRVETDFRFYACDRIASKSAMQRVQCRATLVSISGLQAVLTNMMDISRTKELEHLMRIEDKMSSLGRVATGIVHDIRNPLSAINMYLGGLKTA